MKENQKTLDQLTYLIDKTSISYLSLVLGISRSTVRSRKKSGKFKPMEVIAISKLYRQLKRN